MDPLSLSIWMLLYGVRSIHPFPSPVAPSRRVSLTHFSSLLLAIELSSSNPSQVSPNSTSPSLFQPSQLPPLLSAFQNLNRQHASTRRHLDRMGRTESGVDEEGGGELREEGVGRKGGCREVDGRGFGRCEGAFAELNSERVFRFARSSFH